MKKALIYTATLFATTLGGCNVLDVDPTDKLSETTTYSSIKNLDLYVKSFYGILYTSTTCEIRSANLSDGFSDLVKYSWYNTTGGTFNKFFYTPNYLTPENCGFMTPWSDLYRRIRQTNEYFADLSAGYADGLDPEELKIRTAETRFMRAFAYQDLALRHGGVILRVSETSVDGPEEKDKARSSKEDTWDFIINEYRKAAADLPEEWDSSNTGRVTKGSAWGMMARAALYAGHWDEALEACNEVEKLAAKGIYQLMDEYSDVFTVVNNKELLVTVNFDSPDLQHDFDTNFAPTGDRIGFCGGVATPTDEFASSFDIQINGEWKAFDWDEVITENIDPWTNRDPRFYATILYNGADWKGRKIELFVDGVDGFVPYTGTADDVRKSTTGYSFRKFVKEDPDEDFSFTKSDQFWIEMRYAEILLIKSEAYARKNDFTNAYIELNKLRQTRSSVQLPALPQQTNWDSYLTDLQKERICELGLEGHRYWDLRRWGIAEQTLNGSRVHGIKITKNSDDSYTYERVDADTQDRIYTSKYDVAPIPQDEIRNNTLCKQDPAWE